MDLTLDVTSSCRVRVLLVPVSPIKKSTFCKYVELVKTFNLVRLGDVTPDLKKGASAMFSSQVFQEGQMHFQFLTQWAREHAELEDFQPYRRIFGVIGIMDCQEWKDKDLSEGYKQFAESLDEYPTAVATRCFAFDPSETQEDDTKGLIMIPNVGNMSFYMSTMICDFASEILDQFAFLASRIENLSVLESPLPTTIHVPSHREQKRYSQPPLSISPSSSSSIIKRASLQPQSHHRDSNQFDRLSGTVGESSRVRKRTPGRVKKLLGDFYLLAGRLPDALSCFDQAIEMAKITSDFLWLASAMEGWVCATILLEYLQADVGHIVSRNPIDPDQTGVFEAELDEMVRDAFTLPTPVILGPRSTLTVVAENYANIIKYYLRVSLTASFPVPDLVYAESCLKIARALTTAYLNSGWNDRTVLLIVQGKLTEDEREKDETSKRKKGECKKSSIKDMEAFKKSGVLRYEIAQWITKVWEIQIDELALLDQIHLTTVMSSMYSSVGYHRKAAWLMHESIERMIPLLIQHRRPSLTKNGTKMSTTHDSGVLEILKRVCETYGIGQQNVQDGGALDAIREEDKELFKIQKKQTHSQSTRRVRQRFGWPQLQIDILKQCISVSDALMDNGSRLYYTTVLLKNFYLYLTKVEQIKLATTIQGLVPNSGYKDKKQYGSEPINYWGVNIVSRIEANTPISRKAVYAHPIKNEAVANSQNSSPLADEHDPFIYNPFAKKIDTTYIVLLVKGELSEFKVTLINPFGFDLELQNIVLSTSGVSFNAIPTAAIIPANATVDLPLTGIPLEIGTLTIRGCLIQIAGFTEQEFLIDNDQKNSSGDTSTDNCIKIKSSGINAIKSNKKMEALQKASSIKFYELDVINDQPLLKVKRTSLLHNAVMLYEGEATHITIDIENIGNIAVDFITLSFTDSTTTNPLTNPELSPEEQYEVELYTKGTRVFSWEGSSVTKSNYLVGKKIWLPQGAITTIKVDIYGKRGCQNGTIQIDYGYLDRTVEEIQPLRCNPNNGTKDEVAPAIFYTRQLYLNILITVYQNLEPFNWDAVYLRHTTPASKESLQKAFETIHNQKNNREASIVQRQPVEDLLLICRNIELKSQERNEYCLVTFDIRNTWTIPFDVEFTIDNSTDDKVNDSKEAQLASYASIPPGSTMRIILPLKQLFLSRHTCTQEVPSLDPNKQFVVAQGPKITQEEQQARLQMFWYREELLRRIKATWRCRTSDRSGILNLRSSLRLTSLQLSILKKEDVGFLVDLKGHSVDKLSHRRFTCKCNEYVTLNISIRNRFNHPIKLILRLQPVQSYNDGVKEFDLSDKLLVEGAHQVVLPETPAKNGLTLHTFPLYFLSRGQFELLYHAEDVHTRKIHYDHEWAIVDVT